MQLARLLILVSLVVNSGLSAACVETLVGSAAPTKVWALVLVFCAANVIGLFGYTLLHAEPHELFPPRD